MSRVFLAEETPLGRQVVVKVLPPETRRRRSTSSASSARSSSPPGCSIRTSSRCSPPARPADLLYYVMPFIEGESLRAKLAREGELPVAEASQDPARGRRRAGLRPPARRRPPRHQARQRAALRRPRGGHRFRRGQGGERVERRRPRSPRSAWRSARRPTWRRSRPRPIRTWITAPTSTPSGRWPTRCWPAGRRSPRRRRRRCSPRTSPRRPSRSRGYRPAVLARRSTASSCAAWRSAPPTAGRAPPSCWASSRPRPRRAAGSRRRARTPVVSSGTEEAIRQEPPGAGRRCSSRAASAAVLAVVYLLVQQLGLPDWVLYGAIGLLLLGLPIMLVTGHLERRRALAGASGRVVTTPERGHRRLVHLAQGDPGGVLAFAALGVVAAAYTAMRLLGIGPVGTLRGLGPAQGAGPARGRRLREPDRGLQPGRSVTEAFRMDLAQSPTVRRDGSAGGARRAAAHAARRAAPRHGRARPRDRRARGGQGGGHRADRPVGQGYVLSARLVSAADGSGWCAAGDRREPGRPAQAHRPAVREGARADRRVAHDHPRQSRRWTR